jgi:uncharacterized repeat protein (TIGR03803 family)
MTTNSRAARIGRAASCAAGLLIAAMLAGLPAGAVQIQPLGGARPPGPGFSVLYAFTGSPDGFEPQAGVCIDKNGDIFGTTLAGGQFGNGTLYRLTPSGASYAESLIHSFDDTDGNGPSGRPIVDKNGNVYVTVVAGGSAQLGTLLRLSPSGGGYVQTGLHQFAGPEGAYPESELLERGRVFYATTAGGGAYGFGSIIEISAASFAVKDVYDFKGAPYDGADSSSNLIADASGALYGTTRSGGSYNLGTVFRFVPAAVGQGTLTTLWSFHGGSDGTTPYSGVIRDYAGNIYGTTAAGGDANGDGVVFKLSPVDGGYEETILHNFAGSPDGSNPTGSLIFKGRAMYATTYNGGLGAGTIFRITTSGAGYAIAHDFTGYDGGLPRGNLVSKGSALYGTTDSNAGPAALGEVWRFIP